MRIFLKGELTPGMFPNERFFRVLNRAGNFVTFIVAQSLVESRDNQEVVRVNPVESNNEFSLVHVPGEPLESGSYISVPNSQIILAAS